MRCIRAVVLLVAFGLAPIPAAAAEGERLGILFPEEWREGYQAQAGDVMLSEWVPAGQTVEAWTDMITVTILRGRTDLDPVAYLQSFQRGFQEKCGEFRSRGVASREERGRPTAVGLMECRQPDRDGFAPEVLLKEIEVLMVKAIRGLDNFYVVQRAWHGDAVGPGHPMHSQETGAEWVRFMEQVQVCDWRTPGVSCR